MDIVCFGQQNWDYCWTAKQQLMTRLARRGHRILYVDPSPVTAGRPGPRREPAGELWIHTPRTLRLGWRLSRRLDAALLGASLRRLGFGRPLVLALRPMPVERIEALDPLAVIYYAVDEHTGFGGMSEADRERARRLEEGLLARADLCLAVSPRLCERFRRGNPASFVLENGADTEHYAPERLPRFAPHEALADVPGPVVGFIGQVDDRLDQPLLAALADARPDHTIILAGREKTGVEFALLRDRRNIRFLGYQPYAELPRMARHVDVWLVPYLRNTLTQSCNPLKVYEYLATGKPVISVPLDGLGACREAVMLADGPAEFLQGIDRALADPDRGRARRLAVARANDWHSRVDALEAHLRGAAERAAMAKGTPLPARCLIRAGQARRRLAAALPVDEYGQRTGDPGAAAARRLAQRLIRAWGAATGRSRQVRRILVARRCRLGDFVAIQPALAALRHAFPDAWIVLGVQADSGLEPLARACPDVDEVAVLEFAWLEDRKQQLARWRELFDRRFDLVITGSRWFLPHEAAFTGARRRIGIFDGSPLQAEEGLLLPRDPTRHEADNNLDLVEALTGRSCEAFRWPLLNLDESVVAARRERLAATLALPESVPILLVHPGANRPSRRWPAELLAAALERVLEDNPEGVVVFTGVAAERPLAAAVLERLPPLMAGRVLDLTGATDLFGLVALLDRARALLCNDTGILHLARARGTPLVATLGPEDERLWGPYPVGAAPAVTFRTEVPCAPCARIDCPEQYCLRSLEPAAVAAEIGRLLTAGRQALPSDGHCIRRFARAGWQDLAAAGHRLPLVSVLVASPDDAALRQALRAAENQLYPAIEVIAARRGRWRDRRDEPARRRLPLRLVELPDGPDPGSALLRRAAGHLIVYHPAEAAWWPGRIGADVAAAMRAPEAQAFIDGLPVALAGEPTGGATIRRAALTVPARSQGAAPLPIDAPAYPLGRTPG